MPMLIGHRRRVGLVPVPVPVPVLFSSLVIGGKRADDGGQWTVVDGGGGGLSKGRGLMGATGCRWMVRCLAAMPLRWRCLFGHCRLAISCHLLPSLATPCHALPSAHRSCHAGSNRAMPCIVVENSNYEKHELRRKYFPFSSRSGTSRNIIFKLWCLIRQKLLKACFFQPDRLFQN